jgi:uncharacterized protein (TIGR03435 family)
MCKWCKAGGLLLLALFVVAVSGPQSQARGPAFETISIKPAPSGSPRDLRIRVLPNGDFTVRAAPVSMIISYAYDLPSLPSQSRARLFEPRPWPGRFDIEAKASANAVPAGLSASERHDRVRHMVRALLADRIKLVMRVEQKTMPVHALTVAKGGPKFKKSAIAEKDCIFDFPISGSCHGFADGRGHPLTASAITMDDLALYIGNWADMPVVNRTALSGLFALESDGWRPMRLPPRSAEFPKVPNFDDLPTIFTVLGKLGLELNRQDATLPIYTVESMELPAAQ